MPADKRRWRQGLADFVEVSPPLFSLAEGFHRCDQVAAPAVKADLAGQLRGVLVGGGAACHLGEDLE